MPWYNAAVSISIEVEAANEDEALDKAENLVIKKVVGQEFGHARNDRARVTDEYSMDELTEDDK